MNESQTNLPSREEALPLVCLLVFARKQIDVLIQMYYDIVTQGSGGSDVRVALDPVVTTPTNDHSAELCLLALHTAPLESVRLACQQLSGILTGPMIDAIEESKREANK